MHLTGPSVVMTKIDLRNPEIVLMTTEDNQSGLECFLSADLSPGLWYGQYVGSWGFYNLNHRYVA